jgi:hypothetical protein
MIAGRLDRGREFERRGPLTVRRRLAMKMRWRREKRRHPG